MALPVHREVAFNYSALDPADAAFLRETTGEIRQFARVAITQIGAKLIEAKARVGHGYFLPWLEAEFDWSESTAQRYMRVSESFKSVTVTDLPIDAKALYLLSAPSVPQLVRDSIVELAKSGERITPAAAREAVREFHPKIEKAMADYVAKHTASASPPPQPAPPKVLPKLEKPVVFKRWTEAEGDWQVDFRDFLDFIDGTAYSADRAVELAADFGITLDRIQSASEFFRRMEACYGKD